MDTGDSLEVEYHIVEPVKPARQRLGEVSVRGASDVTRGQASHKTHHGIAVASQPDRLRQQKLVPGVSAC